MKKFNVGGKALTILGFVATGIGFAMSALSDWVGEKKIEEMVQEEVRKQIGGDLNEN